MAGEDKKEIKKVAFQDQFSSIERFRKGDVTVITISGRYTPKLKANALNMVKALRGNVGLEIRDVSPIDLSFASFLRAMQQQVMDNHSSFLLLKPPSRIVDMLNMCYGPDEFVIISDETEMAKGGRKPSGRHAQLQHQNSRVSLEAERKVRSLRREVIKTEEREKSLEIARARLIKMLPQVAPRIPRIEIGFLYKPMEQVGGDLYTFADLGAGRHGVFIGDVSGHGIEAAVVVGMAKKVFDIYSKILITPARVLAQSNREIYPDLDANTFISGIYGVLDQSLMTFTYARAGHPHPILYNEVTGEGPEVLPSKGMSLGLDGGRLFDSMIEEKTLQLRRGDILLLYTDGVTEAMDPHAAREFGVPALLEAIRRAPSKTPARLVAYIYQAISDFSESSREESGKRQQDDVTIIAIRAS